VPLKVRKRSRQSYCGFPLVDVAHGADPVTGERRGKARGIIAIGDSARGILAMGGHAVGIVAMGGSATGIVAMGGSARGVLALGGVAIAPSRWAASRSA